MAGICGAFAVSRRLAREHGAGRSPARPLHLLPLAALAAGLVAAPAAPAADPLVSHQWALRPAGAIGAPAAWRHARACSSNHPDLAANLWTNPGEVAGNGVDDDHDGYVDDVHGANLVAGDGVPTTTTATARRSPGSSPQAPTGSAGRA